MKKPETPPHSSRKRTLSEEEKALWHAVARSATPLRRRKAIVLDEVTGAAQVTRPAARRDKVTPVRSTVVKPVKPSPPPLAPLGRRERSQLAKGRKSIDARIDLHGMTQERAHRRLIGFLQGAAADGATFVLVITGKGRASVLEPDRGVLRRQVPHWLALPELRSLVVGFEEAGIGHGGEGALYVRLRRMR
jgi:DNA-nicking Smr family endonuclease